MSNNSLTVCNVSIRQDAEGRYFLNDLHRASGNNPKDKPYEWLRNKETQALIAEIIKQEIPASEKINNLEPVKTVNSFTEEQGTYVIKPLVYYYAMWISPAFQLHVINAYDALVTNFLSPITSPISFDDFNQRHQILTEALANLKNAQVVTTMTGAQLMSKPLQTTLFPEKPLQPNDGTRRRRLWTAEEIAQLHTMYQEGYSYQAISEKIGRTLGSIKQAIHERILCKAGA